MTRPTQWPFLPSVKRDSFGNLKTIFGGMSSAEWESLATAARGAASRETRDEDTGKIYFTHVSVLQIALCWNYAPAKDYGNPVLPWVRTRRLTPENVFATLNAAASWLLQTRCRGLDSIGGSRLFGGDPAIHFTNPRPPCAGGCRARKASSRMLTRSHIVAMARRTFRSGRGLKKRPTILIDR